MAECGSDDKLWRSAVQRRSAQTEACPWVASEGRQELWSRSQGWKTPPPMSDCITSFATDRRMLPSCRRAAKYFKHVWVTWVCIIRSASMKIQRLCTHLTGNTRSELTINGSEGSWLCHRLSGPPYVKHNLKPFVSRKTYRRDADLDFLSTQPDTSLHWETTYWANCASCGIPVYATEFISMHCAYPQRDGQAELTWTRVTCQDGLSICLQTRIQMVTGRGDIVR